MSSFLTLIWFLAGPVVGYYAAKRRDASPIFGILLGFLCGPCIGALLIPMILGFFTGTDVPRLPKNSTGRSINVDDLPDPDDKPRLPTRKTNEVIIVGAPAEEAPTEQEDKR